MFKAILATALLIIGANAFAREPKATLCSDQAIQGATAIFNLNNKDSGEVSFDVELVDMNHSEGGSEVWDIKFKKNGITYSPYRITVLIDGCVISGFELPFAG